MNLKTNDVELEALNKTAEESQDQSRDEMMDMMDNIRSKDHKACCFRVRGDSIGPMHIYALLMSFIFSFFEVIYYGNWS